ncbi:MAG: protein translocase subunit SecD [Candidatus Omnitrophota bacterium]
MRKDVKWKILLIVVIVLLSVWSLYPPLTIKDKDGNVIKEGKINLGLDLQGGMRLVLKVDTSKLPKEEVKNAPDVALEIIRNRIDQFGIKEVVIQRQGIDEIVVQLPGITDRKRALELIGETALLEFRLVSSDPEKLKSALGGNVPEGYELKVGERDEQLLLETKADVTGADLKDASVKFQQTQFNQPVVGITFNKDGSRKFAALTRENVGQRLAIVLDGNVKSAPNIKEEIPSGEAIIEGRFNTEEANDLAIVLRAGSLPAPVIIEEERTVGPLLGRDSIKAGLQAVALGFILVIVFMLIYYMVAGLIADIALLLNLVIMSGIMGFFGFTLTLPGIAGLILTIGMAVDANVLIFERMREEFATGKTLRSVISIGYSKAFSAILDSNLTTVIAGVMLFQFGTGPVRGFAVTLIIGIITSMFTALVVTRVIFDLLSLSPKFTKLRMLQLLPNTNIDFVGMRRICYVLSGLIIIGGAAIFMMRGDKNFGVDFTGGTLQEFKFQNPVDILTVRKALGKIGLSGASIQQFSGNRDVLIRTYSDTYDKINDTLNNEFPDDKPQTLRIDKVGPSVGKLLRKNASTALLLGLAGILIYIAIRFKRWEYGLAGIIALFHDILASIGAMALTNKEIDLTIVAALLTIAGYSINDTVVIYDRIRENMRLLRKTDFAGLINASVNQTLSRTILTTFTTLLTVISIYFIGGEVLHNFAFCLLIGFISGVYSTVFIASPLLIAWHRRKK